MSASRSAIRIGISGSDGAAANERHGCGLWPAGYVAAITAAGATPVPLGELGPERRWHELLDDLHGVLLAGCDSEAATPWAEAQRLCEWCRKRRLPLLGIDQGLHLLNATYGGNSYQDLPRELPEAIQHRHPPEKGLRHAINVEPGTRLAQIYGEGEVVVNSEHRRAICKVAKGFCIGARALDGVIEAIEAETDSWFALGVQWHPASATASGLDIQLFRGLVEACAKRCQEAGRRSRVYAA
jgi:putative glutamine amidotransferase